MSDIQMKIKEKLALFKTKKEKEITKRIKKKTTRNG